MKINYHFLIATITILLLGSSCNEMDSTIEPNSMEDQHPGLVLTSSGLKKIKSNLGNIPVFDRSLAIAKQQLDQEIENGIEVPIPKDYSGGYTHERHKKNYRMMQNAGLLYQILGDEKYADYVKKMLFAYAELYPSLPKHPQTRSYARGKLFWQCLNDSNWLVYTSQAYDCVYNYLSKEEREVLETNLFRPFADYISLENPQFFNRVHNHSTWGNVAVGMIALVLDDDILLQRALNGIKADHLSSDMKDNDGGYIRTKGQKVGFLANLDEPFSPDGYYTEGPYYQRYAMYPFMIFAQALQNKKPELKIFQHKDSVLIKAVDALINLSDQDGEFFLLNDAQKGMSYHAPSLVAAVDIGYHFGGNNPSLLSIAEKQNLVTLDDAGVAVALNIKAGKAQPFVKKSIELSDGPKGEQGAVSVIRSGDLELVYKYTAHGLSHGHYDKLSFSLFDQGDEVIQDYGLARFVNIEQKGGGNYLKENKTWAKQTVAHNTVVQDQQSHFSGTYELGSKNHSEKYITDFENKEVQVVSAVEENAYPGTRLQRTFAIIKDEAQKNPFVLDITQVQSTKEHQFDMPLYYLGQPMKTSFTYDKFKTPKILGSSNGYQHLYQEAKAHLEGSNFQFSWLSNGKFYTYTAINSESDELLFNRIGANDPEYNLRNEPGLMLRKKNVKDALFVSIIESHGTYSPVSELAVNANSFIENIKVIHNSNEYTLIQIEDKKARQKVFAISNLNNRKDAQHQLKVGEKTYSWEGPFALKPNN